jgi:uncharacterized caspase-like protein
MLLAVGRAVAIALCVGLLVGPASAARRVALVIGNANYVAVPALRNPGNDSAALADTLRQLGFDVSHVRNADKATFEAKIREFADSAANAEAAVFFYAGHGLQVDGHNYMVPVDAKIADEADLPFQLVAVDILLQRLAHNRVTNIVILDACRDNPLGDKLSKSLGPRSDAVGHGLASNVALDGEGDNSPFAEALLRHVGKAGVDVLGVMKEVRKDVFAKTKERQVPFDTSSLVTEFFFKPPVKDQRKESDGSPARDEGSRKSDSSRAEETGRPPIDACDEIAASASDPERVTAGVTFGALPLHNSHDQIDAFARLT